MGRSVKQWQLGPVWQSGHAHSEQRKRHPARAPLVRQQNHSPPVTQPAGQPPPTPQLLHWYAPPVTSLHRPTGEKHGLHGPPPQPTQPVTAPSETSVRVRKSPAPSEPAPSSLKNWRRDDRLASFRAACDAMFNVTRR
jgi:hypothetical protein